MGKPDHHQPDFFERAAKNQDLPYGINVPEIETMLLLSIVRRQPNLLKREVVNFFLELSRKDQNYERLILKYVDTLMDMRYIARYDFRYHLTIPGEKRLRELLDQSTPALRFLTFGEL